MKREKMHVGIIGAGAISGIYLKNMTTLFSDTLKVVRIAARNLEHAEKRAAEFGPGIKACSTDQLLSDPEVEMVVVLTPVGTHAELIRRALLAGKHVYTEKTIADSPEKAAELLKLADEKGLWLGAAPDTFLGSALQTARKALDDGLLGEVNSFAISANRCNSVLLSMFSFLRQPGAGILYDYGVYYLTALVSLLGPIARVGGVTGTPYPRHVNIVPETPDYGKEMDTPNESQVSAVVQLRNGITGTFHIDADSNMRDEAFFAIYGTKGILYLTDANAFGGTVRYLPESPDFDTPVQPVELLPFSSYSENSRGIGPKDLADAVRENRTCRASKEMAYHVLEALTAVLRGGEQGSFQNVLSSCERPEPFPVHAIGAMNIGHASFNMKHADEMMHFYRDVLGMREQFSLRWGDLVKLLDMSRDHALKLGDGEQAEALRCRMEELKPVRDKKWLSYLKLAERQYVEFFWPEGGELRKISDRWANAGFCKLNFEVPSIKDIRDRLAAAGVGLDEDIHSTVDGSLEITVHDPDGNEVQFTEYPEADCARISMPSVPKDHSCSSVLYTTQVAYQVKDAVNMDRFYRLGLGFRKVDSLSFADRMAAETGGGERDLCARTQLEVLREKPWIDYYEVAPHQYIELFHAGGKALKEDRHLDDTCGYQHLCIEVADIQAAWDAVSLNGLVPDEPIRYGPDGAYQFWLTDPDGNRLELMQYTDEALHLK